MRETACTVPAGSVPSQTRDQQLNPDELTGSPTKRASSRTGITSSATCTAAIMGNSPPSLKGSGTVIARFATVGHMVAPLPPDAFCESAREFAETALAAHHARKYRRVAIDAGTALEHLAKACLAKRSPGLLAEMKDEASYHSLSRLLGITGARPRHARCAPSAYGTLLSERERSSPRRWPNRTCGHLPTCVTGRSMRPRTPRLSSSRRSTRVSSACGSPGWWCTTGRTGYLGPGCAGASRRGWPPSR